jgi:cytochrome c-type biogenesis protein CcmH
MGESMILAARGYISPEAEAALAEALRRDPQNPVARYYMGAAFAQTGRPESAFETWAGLIADSPEGAPWLESTRAQVYELAAREGVEPPALPAPRRATPEEERAIMADMVARLEARLAAEGGQAGDWLRLVKSHRALGDPAAAEDAAARARAALGADAAQLAAFEQALAAPETAAPAPGAGAHDVREMVARLDARLAGAGGPAADWLKLISSYAALNEPDAARDALARARAALAEAPQELAALEGAIGAAAAPPAAALRNPTAEEMAAAAEMSAGDRQEMIRTMVSGLQERLFADGGTPEEWVRLIRSLGVLGDVEAATAAWRKASEAHAADRSAVSFITEAAALAGVAIR